MPKKIVLSAGRKQRYAGFVSPRQADSTGIYYHHKLTVATVSDEPQVNGEKKNGKKKRNDASREG